MIYNRSEIDEMIKILQAGGDEIGKVVPSVNKKIMQQAADMMDDMKHALDVWDTFSSYLNVHGMIPTNAQDAAKFWNRDQDKENLRIFVNTDN